MPNPKYPIIFQFMYWLRNMIRWWKYRKEQEIMMRFLGVWILVHNRATNQEIYTKSMIRNGWRTFTLFRPGTRWTKMSKYIWQILFWRPLGLRYNGLIKGLSCQNTILRTFSKWCFPPFTRNIWDLHQTRTDATRFTWWISSPNIWDTPSNLIYTLSTLL